MEHLDMVREMNEAHTTIGTLYRRERGRVAAEFGRQRRRNVAPAEEWSVSDMERAGVEVRLAERFRGKG